jgi:hypothetical protein
MAMKDPRNGLFLGIFDKDQMRQKRPSYYGVDLFDTVEKKVIPW